MGDFLFWTFGFPILLGLGVIVAVTGPFFWQALQGKGDDSGGPAIKQEKEEDVIQLQ